jgi:ketosteroid isomerase-like protein
MKTNLWIVTILLIGCSAVFGQSDKDKVKVAGDIRSVMDKQVAAWNAGDIDGFMAGYWRSPDLIFISGDTVTRGWQTTLDRYKKGYDSRAKMGVLTFSDIEVKLLSRDAAVVLGSWSLAREKDNPHGKFTLTFRKLKEGWRIVMDHTS